MTPEDNKNIVGRFIDQVINGQSEQALEHLTTRDYVLYFPGVPGALDRSQSHSIVTQLHNAFPDFRVAVQAMVADNDWVAVTVTGTNKGPYMGMQPTGKRVRVPGAVFYHLRDGKIVEDRPVYDQLTLLRQMGLATGTAEPVIAGSNR